MNVRGSILRAILVIQLANCGIGPLSAQSPGFVTLQGRDFILDGQPFYPIVMNYSVLLVRSETVVGQPQAGQIYFAPDASFGPTLDFDCTNPADCQGRLLTDFQKVRSMGFNTVRITGGFEARYRDTPEEGFNERRYWLDLRQHPFPNGNHDANRIWVPLEEDLNGPFAQRYFDQLRTLLDVAEQADLKVILLPAGTSSKKEPAENRRYMYQTFDQAAVDDYAFFLGRLAGALQDHPALLAYDLFNEPHYNWLQYQGVTDEEYPNAHPKWKKEDICTFTEQWYVAIKNAAAGPYPDHLVTLGGLGIPELEVWDPAVLHIDFYSLHIYPTPDYKGDWDIADAQDRYQAHLHWFGQTCPMPWIIGETGFAANDRSDPQYLPHVGVDAIYHQWPYMHGNEADQAAFAAFSLETTRTCGASGWSWWMFQEWRWWDYYYPTDAYTYADQSREVFFGMLHLGDANADWYDKPAVAEVQNYVLEDVPEPPGDEPPNYGNWNNLPAPVFYTGTVVEENTGQPIKEAQVWLRVFNPDDPVIEPNNPPEVLEYLTLHPATTHENGSFEFFTQPQLQGYFAPTHYNLILSAVGAEAEGYGGWFGEPLLPNGTTYELKRNPFHFDSRVQDLALPSTQAVPLYRHEGWTELAVENVTASNAPDPGASTVEFVARQTVHVTGEFHAEVGTEVHLFLEETFPDCDDDSYRAFVADQGAGHGAQRLAQHNERHVELQFEHDTPAAFAVHPNPFNTYLEVTGSATEPMLLELFDAMGHIVGQWTGTGSTAHIAVPNLPAGPYQLRIINGQRVLSYPLIKRP